MKNRIIFLFISAVFLTVVHTAICEVLFSDDYNDKTGWHSSDVSDPDPSIPSGYTGMAGAGGDNQYELYDSEYHYDGEISSGGRTGNSLKLWRHNTGKTGYTGYLGKNLSSSEFNDGHKDFYTRWYIKIDPDWDADLATAQSFKLNRVYIGSVVEGKTYEWYANVNGATFKTGKFMFYNTGGAGVWYSQSTVTQLGVNDGEWHSLEWHMKLNSATSVADGLLEFWIDGEAITICDGSGANCDTQITKDFGASSNDYFTSYLTPAIGNLTDGVWDFPINRWYAIEFDDLVISTEYIGPLQGAKSTASGGSRY